MYSAPNEETARGALEECAASELGVRYPQTVVTWQRAWRHFTPFQAFPPILCRVVYTTNAIESLNYQLRKFTKKRGHLPSEEAAIKLLWLEICNIKTNEPLSASQTQANPPRNEQSPHASFQGRATTNWKQALAQFATAYPDRITPTSNPHAQKVLTGSNYAPSC